MTGCAHRAPSWRRDLFRPRLDHPADVREHNMTTTFENLHAGDTIDGPEFAGCRSTSWSATRTTRRSRLAKRWSSFRTRIRSVQKGPKFGAKGPFFPEKGQRFSFIRPREPDRNVFEPSIDIRPCDGLETALSRAVWPLAGSISFWQSAILTRIRPVHTAFQSIRIVP